MSNVTCELRPQSVSAHRACNECLVSGGVGHSGFDMLFQAKESEPVNCVTALASWTIATNGRFPGSWSSALGTKETDKHSMQQSQTPNSESTFADLQTWHTNRSRQISS